MPPLLRIEDLTTGYGRIEVLHGVTIDVPAHSVVALLGSNGAGKTTALRAVSGTLPTWHGRIRLGARLLNGRTPHAIGRMGLTLVPEGRGIFPGLTVDDHLHIAARAAGRTPNAERKQRVDQVLETFPVLQRRLTQRAGTMSGGEQQMLAMARAFISRPDVVLMDEISMGLAPLIVDSLYEGVVRLKESGITILLVEQYLTHALAVADLCYVMAKGRITFVGEPAELRASPSLTAGYLSSAAV
jgi:branched-chain amino acid transport system ATP-binding protein